MKGVFVHETASVEDGAIVGKGSKIWHYAHVREGAVLGENCNLGHCGFIDQDVKIGDNVKMGNKVSVFKGVQIEDDVMIAPHAVFTNDKRPRSRGDWKLVKTHVKKGASIGANSTILCGLTIGKNAMTGAGSVVTRDVPDHGLVYGNPARLIGFVCECGGKARRKSENDGHVIMRCDVCDCEFEIEKDIYDSGCK